MNNKFCICIDIENKEYLYVFKNFENLIGLFFIDNITICFIFVDKFQIYKINKDINEIFLIKEELKKNTLIKNFMYIHKYKLLFIERNDYLFDKVQNFLLFTEYNTIASSTFFSSSILIFLEICSE